MKPYERDSLVILNSTQFFRGRTSAFILLDRRTSKGKSLLVCQKVY